MSWNKDDIPNQAGRIAIITGANSGIGFEAAKALANKGAHVILACRNASKGNEAIARIKASNANASVQLEALDVSRLDSVKLFATNFLSTHSQLDLLINNAGIMATPFARTEDGFEMQLGTNHLGHFALTGLLLDTITATPNSRIVSLSSMAHRAGKINFNDFNAEIKYNKYSAYCQSKLACLMFAYELQRRLTKANSQSLSLAAHPGSCTTSLVGHSMLLSLLMHSGMSHSAEDGALPTLRAATDINVKGGQFYGPSGLLTTSGYPKIERSTKRSYDENVAITLWEKSEQMTNIHYL